MHLFTLEISPLRAVSGRHVRKRMAETEIYIYFIHQLSEADWLVTTRDSCCAEESKHRASSFVFVISIVC